MSPNNKHKASGHLRSETKQSVKDTEDDVAKLSKEKPRIKVGIQKSGIIDMTPSSPLGRFHRERTSK